MFFRFTAGQPARVIRICQSVLWVVCLSVVTILPAEAGRQEVPGHSLAVPEVGQGPELDGKLDDACWKQAAAATGFVFSRLGVPATETTEAFLCQAKGQLYIAFRCLDSQPEDIRAYQKFRDGQMELDDYVEVLLDTTNRRTGFSSFQVNPLGTQRDQMEGGTATKVQFKGDWKASAAMNGEGWCAEISIPYSVLRYSNGTREFGVNLRRRQQRLQEDYYWVDIGPTRNFMPDKFGEARDLKLPAKVVRFQPKLMPYTLSSLTSGGSADGTFGMDIKQEMSDGLTGLLSIRPDFSTIANSLASIGFSYTQQYLNDTRPFFQEGSRYFNSPWFYSNSVGELDMGAKLYGQWGNLDIGFLDAIRFGERNDMALSVRKPSSDNWGHSLFFVRRSEPSAENNVLSYNLGHPIGDDLGRIYASVAKSLTNGPGGDGLQWNLNLNLNSKFWRGWLSYEDYAPDFAAWDGYIPWPSSRGWHGSLGCDQTFPTPESASKKRLALRQSNVRWQFNRVNHSGGGLWHEDNGLRWRVRFAQPFEVNLGYTIGRHDNDMGGFYQDRLANIGFNIGGDPRQSTWLQYQLGRQGGRDYTFINLAQSFALSGKLAAGITRSQSRLVADDGAIEQHRQDILWLSYDLSSERSFSANLVRIDGLSNFYASFRQSVRQGTDMFFLFGDPNAPNSVSQLICKFVYAL
ncbi:MAG: carbohydrate binding family 9 domain-containing protein [Armatimonadetes bacterium]|nr:carbohydrate binding family 9 domain-containing protein [Armatimonadota bacterium]